MQPVPAAPSLPRLFAAPLSWLPATVHSRLLVLALNHALAAPVAEGELDFLRDRIVTIRVPDAGVAFHLTQRGGRLAAPAGARHSDLLIQASAYDFLVLAGRREDPDTLVFQRRLVMQGDTELGLQIKNLLDSLDEDALQMPTWLAAALRQAAPLYRRRLG